MAHHVCPVDPQQVQSRSESTSPVVCMCSGMSVAWCYRTVRRSSSRMQGTVKLLSSPASILCRTQCLRFLNLHGFAIQEMQDSHWGEQIHLHAFQPEICSELGKNLEIGRQRLPKLDKLLPLLCKSRTTWYLLQHFFKSANCGWHSAGLKSFSPMHCSRYWALLRQGSQRLLFNPAMGMTVTDSPSAASMTVSTS